MNDGTGLSASAIFFVAAGLAAAIPALRWSSGLLRSGRARVIVRRRVIPALELAFAVTVSFWIIALATVRLSPAGLVALGAVLAAIGWAGRAAIDDFGSGIALRMEGAVEPERWVRIGTTEGIVRRVGYRTVEIESDNGERVRYPFSRLARDVIVADAGMGPRAHGFVLEVPKDRPLGRLLADVPAAALLSPWSSTTRPAVVELRAETATHYVLDVTAYSIDPAYNSQIELTTRHQLDRPAGA